MMFANPEGYAPTKKGREFDSMPFFLSDEFKSILEDKIKGTSGPSDQPMSLGGTTSLAQTGGGSNAGGQNQMYKSGFLKDKIVE